MSLAPQGEVVIATSCDDGFSMQVTVLLTSVARSKRPQTSITCYLLDAGISEANKRKIARLLEPFEGFELEFVALDLTSYDDLLVDPLLPHLSRATLLRLELPDILAADVERVLYIDADTLVAGDLTELFETDFRDAWAVAVQDVLSPDLAELQRRSGGVRSTLDAGYDGLGPNAQLFNAGVLLMNLDRFRSERVRDRSHAFLRSNPQLCDQDALNVLLHENWRPADYRWNLQNGWEALETLKESHIKRQIASAAPDVLGEAVIVHYTGAFKPWNSGLGHPARRAYHQAARASGWFSPVAFAAWQAGWLRGSVAAAVRRRISIAR